jgi:subtilisin family serine protease
MDSQRLGMRLKLLLVATLVAIMGVGTSVTPAHPTSIAFGQDKVSADVRSALQNAPVRVNVTLASPASAQPGQFSRPNLKRDVAATQDQVLEPLSASDFTSIYRYDALPGLTGIVSQSGLAKLNADPAVVAITLDGAGSTAASVAPSGATVTAQPLAHSVPMIEADVVHSMGITGSGVTVALLDSGADADHPDLADSISGQECFLSGPGSLCPNGTSRQSGVGAAEDDLGHGTNVTGIITSNGVVSSVGVAPGAKVMLYKVINSSNAGLFSDWDAALNDIIAHHPEVRIINISLVSFTTYTGACGSVDPTAAAAFSTLNAAGVSIFVSSGNNGAKSAMTFPACVPGAVSVGAVYDQNFSSSTFFGCTDTPATINVPTCWSNSTASLDLLAPGSFIVSDGLGGGTSTYTGTSQAAPHAAGVAALMLQHTPNLTPDQVKANLKASLVVEDPVNSFFNPRIDALAAINQPRDHKTDANGDGYSAADEDTSANCGLPTCGLLTTFGIAETGTCKDPGKNCGSPGPPADDSAPVREGPPPADGYGCDVTLDTTPPLKTTKLAKSDVDLDGFVSILDLSKVATWFGNTINPSVTDPRWEGDMDGDGQISILDLTVMGLNFGRTVENDCKVE